MRSHPDLSSLGRAVLGDQDPAAVLIVLGAVRALLRVDSRQRPRACCARRWRTSAAPSSSSGWRAPRRSPSTCRWGSASPGW